MAELKWHKEARGCDKQHGESRGRTKQSSGDIAFLRWYECYRVEASVGCSGRRHVVAR